MKNLFELRVLTAAVCLAATGATMAAPELMRARSAADPSIETMAPSPMAKDVLFGHTGQWLAGVVSTDWDSQYDEMDIRIADDFTVPEGATWKITEVHAHDGMGSAGGELASANLTFFKDRNGKPGKVVAEWQAAPLAKNDGGSCRALAGDPQITCGAAWPPSSSWPRFMRTGWHDRTVAQGVFTLRSPDA